LSTYTPLIVLSAIVLFLYVIPFVMALFGIVRVTVSPIAFKVLEDRPPLSDLEQAGISELTALGFQPVTAFHTVCGSRESQGLILRQGDTATFALIYLTLRAGTSGYPIDFCTFGEDGALYVTANRVPRIFDYPNAKAGSVYVDNLAAHLVAHQKIVQSVRPATIDEAAACAAISRMLEGAFAYSVERKSFVQQGGNWFVSLPHAFCVTLEIMRNRHAYKKPYRTIVKAPAHQDAYIAERFREQRGATDESKARPDVAFLFLGVSILVSLGLFSAWLGWMQAIVIILVVFFHESGHAVAMRIFGYKDMSMFFIPFAGAVVSGTAKNLAVWKQTIVLLAGPLPGLLIAIAFVTASVTGHVGLGSDHPFLRMLVLMSIGINLFNLLPLYFLDGGRLLEIGFFSRWNYAVFVFSVLSFFGLTAYMVFMKSYNLVIILLFMGATLPALWRTARMKHLWKGDPQSPEDVKLLTATVKQQYGKLSAQAQLHIIKSVCARPSINPPRLWETILVLGIYLAIWTPVTLAGLYVWEHTHGGHTQTEDDGE